MRKNVAKKEIQTTLKEVSESSYKEGVKDALSFCVNIMNVPEYIREKAFKKFKIK